MTTEQENLRTDKCICGLAYWHTGKHAPKGVFEHIPATEGECGKITVDAFGGNKHPCPITKPCWKHSPATEGEKQPCVCPKGGIYSDGNVCNLCNGTEWYSFPPSPADTEKWKDEFENADFRLADESAVSLATSTGIHLETVRWERLKSFIRSLIKSAEERGKKQEQDRCDAHGESCTVAINEAIKLASSQREDEILREIESIGSSTITNGIGYIKISDTNLYSIIKKRTI